ncbi:PLSP1, partial [Symbiodinium necroappetens]
MAVQGQLDLKLGDRRALKASIAGMCGLLLWRMQLSCAPHPCFASSPSLRVSRSRPLSREHLAGTAHASSSHARLNCGRTLAAPAALLAGAGAGAAANSRRRRSFAGRKSAQADGEMARDPEAGAERVARDPEAPRSQAAEPSRGEGDDGLKGFVRKLKEDPEFQEDVKTFFTSLTVALLIRGFLVEPRFIPSLSMYPNFDIGDQLTVDKVSKRWREYQRRDVVVFNPPPAFSLVVGGDRSGDALIKRVVALAGDTVEIKNGGTLYINGEAQDEPFTNEAAKYDFGPITVPDGCVFVLGDNRNQSLDGHVWGPLPVENIIGRTRDSEVLATMACWFRRRSSALRCPKACAGRIVNVYGGFGFLKQLGNDGDGQDIFFRAADVIGINCLEPGSASTECLEINLRTSSKKFYINLEDEVSFVMSKDLTGKPCAASVVKERKGAWRTNRGRRLPGVKEKKETIKDQVKRLTAMDTDQVLQNATLFKDILDSPDFEFSHLYKVITMLASKDLLEDTRSDRIYRLFLESNAMQACLRTTIIKQGAGRHHGNFLEDNLSTCALHAHV